MAADDDRIMEFSELLQNNRSRIFGFIYALVLNMADTEDVFQQTAALLWEKFDEFEPGTDFASWALRVARFKAANFLRGRYREKRRFSNEAIEGIYQASVDSPDTNQEQRLEALRGCMEKLTDSDRKLVSTCYAGARQITEIAASEGKTANAVYAALHRIRRSLLDCIRRTLARGERRNPQCD